MKTCNGSVNGCDMKSQLYYECIDWSSQWSCIHVDV